VAATDDTRAAPAALAALMQAALALPILALPMRAGAATTGEVGFSTLGYKERGLIKVTEPLLWLHAKLGEDWEVAASGAVDVVTGASPELVTNRDGHFAQTLTGASINDRRTTGDAQLTRRFGAFALSVSRAVSNEEDYRSRAYGVETRLDLDQRTTTLTAGFGRSADRVRSSIDATLDAPRDTREYLLGVTQVLSPLSVVQSTLTVARGRGDYNDPYKLTLSFYPGQSLPVLAPDQRPDHRASVAWLTRYRRHFAAAEGTLQLDYRYYRDDWGIRAHAIEGAWEQALGERWSIRPALRYYTQQAAEFYSPLAPERQPAVQSSDQRLAAFGGLSPSLGVTLRLDNGLVVEGRAGYAHNAAALHAGGSGGAAFETLRAVYGLVSLSRAF
jgi:hypothetical protein